MTRSRTWWLTLARRDLRSARRALTRAARCPFPDVATVGRVHALEWILSAQQARDEARGV